MMAATSLEMYQTDHLFLLMGENALPNYAAALSLLKLDGIPYLIHTTYTQLQAERLAEILHESPNLKPAQFINLKDSQGDAYAIRQAIGTIAQQLTGAVGMNYTGGTKAMSVHAYRILEQLHPQAIFSYLDSNTLEMIVDRNHQPGIRLKVTPPLSLNQLFRLHGLSWRTHQPPLSRPIQAAAATKLAHLHQSEGNVKRWRSWCHHELRQAGKNEYSRWKEERELAQLPPLSLSELSAPFKAFLQQYFGADANTLSLNTARNQGFNSVTQFYEWLDGIWLEHYTLSQIQAISHQCNIHESGLSFRVQDAARPQGWDKFEFDVAFMRHYQLFAISCTTTEKRHYCKQKLIEANLRARQLGGAEARVALVCCHSYPDSLRSELEVATRNRKIAVFGRQDLPDLGQKIVNWVKQNG